MHQMDLEYEHGCTNNTAIWKRGVKVYSLLLRAGLRVCLASARSSDGEPLIGLGSGCRAGVEHANNRCSVEARRWESRRPSIHQAERKTQAPTLNVTANWAHYKCKKMLKICRWKQSECVCVFLRVCAPLCTVMVMVDVGVASLCGTQSREQVGSGWSRESVLIVFVPQSCLAVVKAASTSWEANCSIYTGRRFPFFLSIFFFFQMYLFHSFYFYNRGMFLHPCVSQNGLAAFNPLSDQFIDRI